MTEPAADFPGACIPRHAVGEWLALARVLADHGPAPCEEGDPELWWPVRGDSPDAAAGCEVCPARAECLAYALAADERDGVWGGTLPAERRAIVHRAA
ncbi:MAG: WhiB family transcriptional regulator [Chloroflexota bacterium]|nr:WhiB family transcriptional regulator [Chloroflexota bacterium]MDP9461046.1 WhiB family transcriptional regulator [Actinomycetota bacterium]